MSNSTLPPLPPNVVDRSGPLILGYLMNWGLFGVVSIQVYFYYMAFPKDKRVNKCLVYGVYLLETLQTMIVTHDAFKSFGSGFGSFAALDDIRLTCFSIPLLSGIAGCVVQLFYAYRINVLSRTKVIGSVISVISIIGCLAGIVTGAMCYQIGSLSKLTETRIFITAGFWWASCAICDVTIAIAMTYLLSRYDTGFRATQILVTRLTRLTLETGTATAVVAIVNLILFFGYPNTNYYTTPTLIIAKLYCNTLLVLFNSRMRIVDGREEVPFVNHIDITTEAVANWQEPDFARSRPATIHVPTWLRSWKDGAAVHNEPSRRLDVLVMQDVNIVKGDIENQMGQSPHPSSPSTLVGTEK